MCWNKEVSGVSFLFILAVCGLFFYRNLENDRLLAFFIIAYGSMQLFEFLIWSGIDYGKQILNIIGSALAAMILYFHPLAMTLGMKYDKLYKEDVKTPLYKASIVLGTIFLCYGIISTLYLVFKSDKWSFISVKDKVSDHLVWDFPDHYFIGLIIIILPLIIIMKRNAVFGIAILCYFLLPIIYFKLTMKSEPKHTNALFRGSYWCWFSASFAVILYFINPYIQISNIKYTKNRNNT